MSNISRRAWRHGARAPDLQTMAIYVRSCTYIKVVDDSFREKEEKREKSKKDSARASCNLSSLVITADLIIHVCSGSIIFYIRLCDALCLRSCALALKKQSVAEWTQAEDMPTAGGLVLQELLVVAEVISIQN